MKTKIFASIIVIMLVVINALVLFTTFAKADQPQWPTSWVLADTDPIEDVGKAYRDVHYASYGLDNNYLYFRLECYGSINFTINDKARYKWFIDINDSHDMGQSGGNVYGQEYLLFVEDSLPAPNGDGKGDIFLLTDRNHDGFINKVDWPDYLNDPGPLNTSVAGCNIVGNCIDVYIRQSNISSPEHPYFTWATDQADPNFNSAPHLDRSDNYWNESLSKADLSIEKSGPLSSVCSGGFFSYTLNVTNWGPNVANNVSVKDTLPEQVSFNSSNPDYSGNDGSDYYWNYTYLGVNDSRLIVINVTANNGFVGTINNTAHVYNDTLDPMPANNEDTEQTTVIYMADLSISKSASASTISPGDYLEYTLIVTNNGPNAAVNVNVFDELPSQVTFNSAVPYYTERIGSVYRWNYPSIGADLSEIIIINVTVNNNATGTITNNAYVTSDTYDPNPGDESNSGSANTTIEDNLAPSQVVNLTVVDAFNGNLGLSWDPATDNVGVDYYEIFRDGVFLVNVTSASFTDSGLVVGVEYNYTVRAVDSAGNLGDFSDEASGISTDNMPPSKVVNLVVVDAFNGNLDLSWDPATDNVGVDYYEIFRNGTFLISVPSNPTSYLDSGLVIGVQYNYTVRAVDSAGNVGDFSDEANGTSSQYTPPEPPPSPPSGPSGPSGPTGGSTNLPPTANAGGPYYGFIGTEIKFNGSKSHDNDEAGASIKRYDWKFFDDDSWHNDTGPTPVYVYNNAGVYTVTLRVFDDEGSSGIDTATVIISQANNPPYGLTITGNTTGYQNTSYTYNISALDLDSDNITYLVLWGDGTSNTSDLLPNGTVYTVDHMWSVPDDYTIVVSAMDELGASALNNATLDVLIVTEPSNNTNNGKGTEDNTWLYLLLIILLICVLLAILYYILRKKK